MKLFLASPISISNSSVLSKKYDAPSDNALSLNFESPKLDRTIKLVLGTIEMLSHNIKTTTIRQF
ncbi:MAG: hypothetical protein IPG53_14260 [Ignavibacteriales bacterium]|nr:hypothetical protein [Ignavibacteriales bacterium]